LTYPIQIYIIEKNSHLCQAYKKASTNVLANKAVKRATLVGCGATPHGFYLLALTF